jgi:hypothetical protein
MERPLGKLAFVLEEVRSGGPGLGLLDRFLAGYARDGAFRRVEGARVALFPASLAGGGAEEIDRRSRDFGLERAASVEEAASGASAAVVGWRAGAAPGDGLLERTLKALPAGAPCFVQGALAATRESAQAALALAGSRGIPLAAGTSLAVAFRLPEVDVPPGERIEDALIVVQGERPHAEHDALEGLLSFIDRRAGAAPPVRARLLQGDAVWRASAEGAWSRDLLAAAVSRSNNILGDPERDGRTQDVVGLGLLPRLARSPRAWVLEHGDGLRAAILVLDGAAGDVNVAVRVAGGRTISAQLYRPPPPNRAELDRLAAAVEGFLRSGEPPWPRERAVAVVRALALMAESG